MDEAQFIAQIQQLEQLAQVIPMAIDGQVIEGQLVDELPPDPKPILNELMERFTYAESWRQQYDKRATEWYKLYVGYREAVKEGSNLHIPRTYEQLDTLRARLVKSFVSQRPYVDFIPRIIPRSTKADVEDNEQKADIAAGLVDHQLELNNITSKFYDHITNMLIFPAAIMGVGWRYDEKMVKRKMPLEAPVIDPMTGQPMIDWSNTQPMIDPQTGQPMVNPMTGQPVPDPNTIKPVTEVIGFEIVEQPEVVWDDNEIINIDYYDFYPDPRATDIDDARFCFHREWMTRDELESKLQLLESTGSGNVYYPNWEELEESSSDALEEGKWERVSSVGLQPETTDGRFKGGITGLYEVLNYWEDTRYCIIINRNALVYDAPNPYWRHNKKPFIVSCFEPLPNEFYGLSAVQLVEHIQHEINTHRNQRIDNVSLVLNRMWKVNKNADINTEDLISRPNGIIWVDNPNDVVEFAMNDVTASSYNEESVAKTDMENTLAVPSVVRGADSGRKETATEIVTKSTNAGMRFDIKIMLFETLGFKRLVRLMDLNNQQFIDDQRLIRLFGEEGSEQWKEVNPWEIVGEFDYRPAGANVDPAANKEVRRQQLMQLLQVAASTQTPYIDQGELWKSLVNSFDLRNTDKLFRSEEEVQQMQMQQMVMQQQAQLQAQQMEQQRLMQEQMAQAQQPQQALPMQQMVGGG